MLKAGSACPWKSCLLHFKGCNTPAALQQQRHVACRRVFAFTALNAHSSRSHAIVMLTIAKRARVLGARRGDKERVRVGRLFLVDLAGSERLKKSRSTGAHAWALCSSRDEQGGCSEGHQRMLPQAEPLCWCARMGPFAQQG